MKKLSLIILAFVSCILIANGQNISVISGTWDRHKPENIKLFKIENGNLYELASSKLSGEGKFLFAFSPEKEGYYSIGLSTNIPRNRFNFYFKPGDQLNVKITMDSYILEGKSNTPENIEMTKWHDFIQPLEDRVFGYTQKGSTYVDFFPLFEEKESELQNYPQANTPNTAFNNSFVEYKKYDFLFQALMFIYSLRSAHPQGEDFPDFYRNINIEDLAKDESILDYPGGLGLLMNSCMTAINQDETIAKEEKSKAFRSPVSYILKEPFVDRIKSPVLKGELAVMFSKNNKTLAGFEEFRKSYEKYVITDSQKARWRDTEIALNDNAVGNNAIDFKFADINGKEIALSDFKGKVVYIDVWATWCGPCKKEFPAMKELEAEYHNNKDMVFMGVSVDIGKDIQKWKDFLEKEQLPGIQTFAGDAAQKDLMGPYKIKGIPRFILVGKDGKLILADAPRPSSGEIRAILNDALKR